MENMFSFKMTAEFFSMMNIYAVLVSTVVFFGLGFLWYSTLFGKAWMDELKKHGVTLKSPEQTGMVKMLSLTLLFNFLIVFGMAFINYHSGSISWLPGFKMGVAIICFIAAPIIGLAYSWEGKSLKLFLIDAGYTSMGILLSSVIIGAWR